ncbi:MAG: DegT/DnrJ/EryC1/StrS family aminotransferase [Anaerolineae bacterium]
MGIPFLDLQAEYRALRGELDAAVHRVLESGHFVLGPEVQALQEELARFCGTRFAWGVASGTDALRLALAALEVGPGHEVITTPFTFVATANTISRAGARPVFVDIRPDTLNLDPAHLEAAITTRTRAIVPVHLFGHPADMDPILEIAGRYGIPVIEDAAQAIGARYGDRAVGSMGAVGCFSFYPTKNLSAYGDGGLVVTQDPDLAAALDVLRNHGRRRGSLYFYDRVGFNSRLDELQAAILRVKLRHLPAWTERRRAIAALYHELLAQAPVVLPVEVEGVYHVYHQYTIRAPQRDALQEALAREGIATMVYYPLPLHLQALYRGLGLAEGSLPEAERAAQEVLSLPIYPQMTDEQVLQVAQAVCRFYGVPCPER